MLRILPLQQLKQMEKITYSINLHVNYSSKENQWLGNWASNEFKLRKQQYCKTMKYNYPYILPDGTSFS